MLVNALRKKKCLPILMLCWMSINVWSNAYCQQIIEDDYMGDLYQESFKGKVKEAVREEYNTSRLFRERLVEKRKYKFDSAGRLVYYELKFPAQRNSSLSISRIEFYYNYFGKLAKEIGYSDKGILNTSDTFIYDEKLRLIEKQCYGKDSICYEKNIYLYDSIGNLVKDLWYAYDYTLEKYELTSTISYIYNKNNKVIEYLGERTGELKSKYKTTILYDVNDSIIEENTEQSSLGNFNKTIKEYSYNTKSKHKVSQTTYYSLNGLITNYQRTETDSLDRICEDSLFFYKNYGANSDYLYRYNEYSKEGIITKSIARGSNIKRGYVVGEIYYNKDHYPIKVVWRDSDSKIVYTAYFEYDKYGNCIRSSHPLYKRSITYYE